MIVFPRFSPGFPRASQKERTRQQAKRQGSYFRKCMRGLEWALHHLNCRCVPLLHHSRSYTSSSMGLSRLVRNSQLWCPAANVHSTSALSSVNSCPEPCAKRVMHSIVQPHCWHTGACLQSALLGARRQVRPPARGPCAVKSKCGAPCSAS